MGRLIEADHLFGASLSRVSGLAADSGADDARGLAGARELRDEYLIGSDVVYLNHASIGTIPKSVQSSHKAYLDVCETNPWLHVWGGAWEEPRETVRSKAAAYVGCDPDEIALTHNTTEGFNVLAAGLALDPGAEVLFSTLNHPGASLPWHHYAGARGFRVRQFEFPVLEAPSLTAADIVAIHAREIGPATRVLVLPHVDNIIGLRHPLRELTEAARARGVDYVAVDGAQIVGMLPVDIAATGVDFYATSPHKWLQAPKGLGVLYVRKSVRSQLRPMWVTWGQERWEGTVRIYEDYGTRNLPELLALGDAIDFQMAIGDRVKQAALEQTWRELQAGVDAAAGLIWRSPRSWEQGASLAAVELAGVPSAEFFATANRERGLVFRPFSTLGLDTVRISPNLINTREEIGVFLEAASRAVRQASGAAAQAG